MASQQIRLSKKMIMLFLHIIVVLGVGLYGYTSLHHDMRLIVERETNIFDVFSNRAKLIYPGELLDHIEYTYTPFSSISDAKAYLYGYELTSHERFALRPIVDTVPPSLSIYRYILSYPEVVGIYLLTNKNLLVGLSSQRELIPERLAETKDLFTSKPWRHYFGCIGFKTNNVLCSKKDSFVSDISDDLLTHRKIFILYFPFHFYNYKINEYQYGLLGIDIDINNAFKHVLSPFEHSNPTKSLISFRPQICPRLYICLQEELMRTKANSALYLIWQYRVDDFIYRQIKSAAFVLIVVTYMIVTFLWSKLSPRISNHFHRDKLTGLPRRDFLDEKNLQKYNVLLLIDIDNFKSVNDTFGHDIGDLVLTCFAEKIKKQLRGEDLALRWGGEEFLILLKTSKGIEAINPVVARLLEPLVIDEIDSPVTISGGLVKINQSHTMEKITKIADKLLYEVKQNGKNNIATKESGKTIFFRKIDAGQTK